MSIESIAALAAETGISPIVMPEAVGAAQHAAGTFESVLSALGELNGQLNAGEQAMRSLAVGDMDNLHQSMMNMERVRLSMQLLLQVRSHAMDAYQELMRMQV